MKHSIEGIGGIPNPPLLIYNLQLSIVLLRLT